MVTEVVFCTGSILITSLLLLLCTLGAFLLIGSKCQQAYAVMTYLATVFRNGAIMVIVRREVYLFFTTLQVYHILLSSLLLPFYMLFETFAKSLGLTDLFIYPLNQVVPVSVLHSLQEKGLLRSPNLNQMK